ncbi:peptide MFS transporter [Gaetbulibacter sp. M240]|uniref:peptide MFS transporter n=1 Tax=Gaetbulibacter sp. M240 TaxID=3126511 RepID=UPI00374FCD85
MATDTTTEQFFKNPVIGHPAGLFVLFFTEMWERFSYYGMRALLVMFFTASLMDEGWGWPREHAMALFGTYTGLVYLSTLMGGYFADKIIGYRYAVAIGALLMTMGHACMALETQFMIYLGLTLLVFGSGFFKPNMTSIISEMYKNHEEKKDGAYTIFYMGVNAGAFLGILLCGYLGERVGWSFGFGLAGIFMFFGLMQFWFSQNIFGDIGKKPTPESRLAQQENDTDKRNPFPVWQLVLIGFSVIVGLLWLLNSPATIISGGTFNMFDFNIFGLSGNNVMIISAILIFVFLLVYRVSNYSKITRDKMIAITFFSFLIIFFWAIFEQAPGTLTIFAKDYTNRVLTGNAGLVYLIVNSLMAIVPLVIINWVLVKLFKQTFKTYTLASVFLSVSFVIIWLITIWMLVRDFYGAGYIQLSDSALDFLRFEKSTNPLTEVPASWFGVLNSLFIITFAPLFSKIWESKYNPSANVKYAIGLTLLGLGMACVAFGASGISPGAQTASVSMIWLILVYLFHTLGELCISPVALSLVSKLSPARMIAFMFGIYNLAVGIGMKLAGVFGENVDKVADENGISYFFWLLTMIALVLAVFSLIMNPVIKKLMHGVR